MFVTLFKLTSLHVQRLIYTYIHVHLINREKKPVYLSKVYPEMNVSENLILLSIFMCLNPL